VTAIANDNVDTSPKVELVSVESNEPDNAKGTVSSGVGGDGNTMNDVVIVDDYHFGMRAERSGRGGGRIYTLTYRATDMAGNTTLATCTVTVPHDRK